MESVTMVVEIINQVGFPIAVSIALLWSNHENTKNNQKNLAEFKEAIRDNTEVLRRIVQKVGA